MDLIRSFLSSKDYFDELLGIEGANGNYFEAAEVAGMKGAVLEGSATESKEFKSIYKLRVMVVPTNKRMIRKDESDVVFRVAIGKWQVVLVEVSWMHKTGRPVLGPTQDEVIANLRSVFESIVREYRIYTEEEKKEVITAGGLHEAFAIVLEASKRVLGLRPFDVQLIGAMVLHKGEIAEMSTRDYWSQDMEDPFS
ncbi:hypothetical protein SUGI_0175070 [Cryptomeria japonica]|nr:hypothetical protein SUGI_0175070 [Cryptomeria japonica]